MTKDEAEQLIQSFEDDLTTLSEMPEIFSFFKKYPQSAEKLCEKIEDFKNKIQK